VALGENQGESFYRARLTMKSTEAVGQVKAITEGFRAIVSLSKANDPNVLKLIDGLKVMGEGKTLTLRWTAKADDVWAAVEKAVEKMARYPRKGGCPMMRGGDKKDECPMHGDAHKGKPCPGSDKPKAHKPKPQNDDDF
jgi:ribosome-associated translation inhibitor RaiA